MKTVHFAILATLLLPLALQAAPENRLKGIAVEENTEGTLITIEGSGTPTFSAFRLQDPPRLLVDIAGAEVTGRQGTVEVYNGVVAQVGTIAFGSGDKKTVRVIVTFEKDAPYDVRAVGQRLLILVDGEGRRGAGGETQLAQREKEHLDKAISREKTLLAQLQAARGKEETLRGEAQKALADEKKLLEKAAAEKRNLEELQMQARLSLAKEQELAELAKTATAMAEEQRVAAARAAALEQQKVEALRAERIKIEALKAALDQERQAAEEARGAQLKAEELARSRRLAMEEEAAKAEELRIATEEALREQQKKLEIARREALLASNEQDAAAKLRAEEERQLKLLAEARKQQEDLLAKAMAAREAQEATAAKLQEENQRIAQLNEQGKTDVQKVEAQKLRAEAEARRATLEKEQREREAEVARLERQKEEAARRALEQEAAAETARLDATRTAAEREEELQAQAQEKRRNEEALASAQQRQLSATEAKLAAAREALAREGERRKVLAEAVQLDARRSEAAEAVAKLRAEHDHAMAEKERIEREVADTRIQLDTLKKEKAEMEILVAQRKAEEANLQTIQTDRDKLEDERAKLEDERAMLSFQIDESRMKLAEFDKAREAKRQELTHIDDRMNLSSRAIEEVNAQLVLEQENLRRMVEQRKEEEKRLETLRENIRQLQASQTAADNELVGKLQGELDSKEQALAQRDQRLAELEKRLGSLSGELDATRKQAGTESDETAKLRSRLEARTRDYERLDREYQDATRRLAELKAGRDEGLRKAGELETRLEESSRRMDEIGKEYTNLLAERERWSSMNKAEKQEVAKLKKDLAKGQTEYAKLLKSREAMEKKVLLMSRDLARAEEEKKGLERGLKDAREQLDGQRTALGEARKRSEDLEQTRQARGEDLLKIQAELDNSRQALARFEAQVETLRKSKELGDADKAKLAAMEQQLEAEKGRGTQLGSEKDKLQQLIAALGAQREAEKKEVERLAFRVKELEVTGSQADKALQESATKLGALKERLDKEQAQQAELLARIEASKTEAAEWKNRYEQLVVASQKGDQEKKDTEAEVTRLRAILEQQRNDLDALRMVTERNRTSGAETTARFEELQSQLAEEHRLAQVERQNAQSLQAELAATRANQTKAQTAWEQEQVRTKAELDGLRAAGQAKESQITELKAQLAQMEQTRKVAEAEAEALVTAKAVYKQNLQARERELARLKAERDAEAQNAKKARESGKLSKNQEAKYQAELKRRDRELADQETRIASLKAGQEDLGRKKEAELASLKRDYEAGLLAREKELAALRAERDAEARNASNAKESGKLSKDQERKYQAELKRREEELNEQAARIAALKAGQEELDRQKEAELASVKKDYEAGIEAREQEIVRLKAERDAEARNAKTAKANGKLSSDQEKKYQAELKAQEQEMVRLKAERDAEALAAGAAKEKHEKAQLASLKKDYETDLQAREKEIARLKAEKAADSKVAKEEQDRKKTAELAALKRDYEKSLQAREQEISKLKAQRDEEAAKASKAKESGKLNQAQEAKFKDELKRRDRELAQAEAATAALKAGYEESQAQALAAKEDEIEALKAAKEGELRAREAEIEVLKAKLRENKTAVAKAAVKAVDFDGGKGRALLKITLEGEPSYQVESRSDKDFLMILDGTSIPAPLQRTLDTQEFGSPVAWVSSYEDPARKGRTVISVHLKETATNSVISSGGSVQWSFRSGSEAQDTVAAAASSSGAQTSVVGQSKNGPQTNPAVVTAGLANPQNPFAVVNPKPGKKKKKYSGKRINLSIKDADIQHVLAFLSRVGGVNIVTSDGVRGNVSFYLEDVPWDLALDMILKSSGMDYVTEDGIYRVAPQSEIQKEYEVALDKQKKIVELKQLQVKLIPVNYANADALSQQIKSVLSEKGQISVDKRTNTIIVKDIEEHVQALDDLVRRLDAQTPQVLIEARIVEASNDFTREVGVQWGGSLQASPEYANQTGLIFPSSVGLAGGSSDQSSTTNGLFNSGNPNYAVNLPAAAGQGSGGSIGLSLGSVGGAANLYLRLSAAESEGIVKIISAPRISTVDNSAATIQQGVSFPVSVVSAQGVNTQFFDANLKLDVVPHVTQDGNIQLKIDITKNEPDFSQVGANGTPTIRKKEAHTELLLKDGDTTVIGGIFTRSTSKNYKKVPFFADIPLLGWFFRSNKEADQRSEMLIFITPRIVNRQAARVDTVVD